MRSRVICCKTRMLTMGHKAGGHTDRPLSKTASTAIHALWFETAEIKMRAAQPGASISVVSEPRAVATGSYAQLSINTFFVSYCLIRSLPLAVLTRFVATSHI